MNRHVGASFALSVFWVVLFAVLLYQPERGPDPAPPPTSKPAAPDPAPPPTPPPMKPAAAEPVAAVAPAPRIRPVSRTRPAATPRSAFTIVAEGETLDDVASRVYGTADRAESLWRANRDLLGRPRDPLRPGMLLRTP